MRRWCRRSRFANRLRGVGIVRGTWWEVFVRLIGGGLWKWWLVEGCVVGWRELIGKAVG